MRQLGDFAAWLGLILIVLGVVYYTPKLVEYVSDDVTARPKGSVVVQPSGRISAKRNMAMHHMGFDRAARSD